LLLVGTAMALSVTLGTWIGARIARRPGSTLDAAVSTLAVGLFSVPVFWFGLMLILLFSVQVPILPAMGMSSLDGPREGLGRVLDVSQHLVLPVLSLMTVSVGQYIRIARTSVAEVMGESYITTVRAIGFSDRRIVQHYALRNALLPVVTVLGLQLGLILTGAVLTETVFSWPGLGRLIYEAILARDTPVIMGAFIAMSITVAIASLATDLIYAALDPRVTL
jgi:peptide/nickel transport system permease protein